MALHAIIVMGVSGSGKTTVGQRLALRLGWKFVDADDFHDAEAIARMRNGHGLTDAEREPWLLRVRNAMAARIADGEHVVVACSALKASYRDALRPPATEVQFAYLRVPRAVLERRLAGRDGHFAGVSLLESQLAVLEEPSASEAWVIDAALPLEEVVEALARNTNSGGP